MDGNRSVTKRASTDRQDHRTLTQDESLVPTLPLPRRCRSFSRAVLAVPVEARRLEKARDRC